MLKNSSSRNFGLDLIGEIPWGTHLCQFYESKEDLIDILVPYFAEGLRNNEFCMWVTSQPLEVEEAKKALRKVVPNLDEYVVKKQIEILSYMDWYLLRGKFDSDRVINGWMEKERNALDNGFEGLRLTGNTFWIERNGWQNFTNYEATINFAIKEHRMIALCTYSLERCSATDMVDVIKNHVGTLIRREGKWCLVEEASERKQIEKEFRSIAKFPSENPYPVLRLGRDGSILYSNPAYQSLLGKERSAGQQVPQPHWRQLAIEVLNSGLVRQIEEALEDVTFSYTFVPIVDSGYVNIYGNNITESKKLEEALRESEERFRAIAETSPIQISVSNFSDNTILFANTAYEQAFGFSKGELIGKQAPDLYLDPADRIALIETLKKNGFVRDYEVRVKRRDGTPFWVSASIATVRFSGKEALIGASIDITERKILEAKNEEYAKHLEKLVEERNIELIKANEALQKEIIERKQAEEKLRSTSLYVRNLIEVSLDPLVTISAEGKITDVNEATEVATGYSREELIGSDFSDYFTEPEKAKEGYQKVFTEGFVRDYPLAIRHASGRTTDVLYNATLYRNEAGKVQGVFAAARDITEHNAIERKLKDSERLAAIGQTAGMVGHDMRNPLQAITGSLYLMREDVESLPESAEKKDLKELLESIDESVEYLDKIVADLQDYVKPIQPMLKTVDLRPLLEETLKGIRIPNNVETALKVVSGFDVRVDPALMRRVFTNLAENAVQAMHERGSLTVEARSDESGFLVSFSDTGVGIPEDVKSKLFTPLFTTKSKGQGFGLVVCKRIVEAHNGEITYTSEAGKGTVFTVKIPANRIS